MKTLRYGDRNGDVLTLQELLGIAKDGIFGIKTKLAVQKYQRECGLFPDGIVGEKTWAFLTARTNMDGDITIREAFINTHITEARNRDIRYIAIHYTAGSTSKVGAAYATRNVFLTRAASADFVVDDGEIVQVNPDICNYYCWAVGDKKNPWTGGGGLYGQALNRNTVSIEICSSLREGTSPQYPNHDGWSFTEASLRNAAKLVRYLMQKYNVPKDMVIRHYDISGKLCPGVIGWNEAPIYTTNGAQCARKSTSEEWQKFKSLL